MARVRGRICSAMPYSARRGFEGSWIVLGRVCLFVALVLGGRLNPPILFQAVQDLNGLQKVTWSE
jgi:hypothetical protein